MAPIPTWPRHQSRTNRCTRVNRCHDFPYTNERVTRKHYIKPPSIEMRAAMRLLSEAFSNVEIVKLLPRIAP